MHVLCRNRPRPRPSTALRGALFMQPYHQVRREIALSWSGRGRGRGRQSLQVVQRAREKRRQVSTATSHETMTAASWDGCCTYCPQIFQLCIPLKNQYKTDRPRKRNVRIRVTCCLCSLHAAAQARFLWGKIVLLPRGQITLDG